MTRCRCLGSSHGPACPLLDVFDSEAEERECLRIEAEPYVPSTPHPYSCAWCGDRIDETDGGDLVAGACGPCNAPWPYARGEE